MKTEPKDFRRQVDDAADEICEKYEGQDTGERIVRGVIKTATIRKKEVEVFVSYKKKYEEDTKRIVDSLRAWSGSKLNIWYAHDIPWGSNWMQLAPQLKDYQAVPAKQDAVIKFLDDILVQPDAVPGMDPLNKNARELADLASDIVSAFDNLSAVETVWFGNFVELAVTMRKN